jgi:preprotein translocase subunit YajC
MGNSSSPYSTLILVALMVVAFYFLIIRPNKKRQQAQQQTMNTLQPGVRVLLTSGLFGTIVEIGQKQALLELSPGVHLTVLKQAIARVVRDGDEDTTWDSAEDDDESFEEVGDTDSAVEPLRTGTTSSLTTADGDSTTPVQSEGSSAHGSQSYRPGDDNDPRSGTNTTPIKD